MILNAIATKELLKGNIDILFLLCKCELGSSVSPSLKCVFVPPRRFAQTPVPLFLCKEEHLRLHGLKKDYIFIAVFWEDVGSESCFSLCHRSTRTFLKMCFVEFCLLS